MKKRLVVPVAVAIAAAAISYALVSVASLFPSHARIARATLAPRPASYLGVYAAGTPGSYQPAASFAEAVGRRPNLIGYYSGWGEPFAASFAQAVRRHGAVTLIQLDPTHASIPAIATGGYDGYLRAFASAVRDFGHPVVIGFGHEMNATWYSWGYRHVPAAGFIAAWRHIVTLFRGQRAGNVTWLWTINQVLPGTGPVTSWWPGARYVTWVGIDGYYYRRSDTFASVFGKTIVEVRSFTGKPVLLSETAVGPGAGQTAKIPDLFAGMRHYHTLGLVWFDIAQHRGVYHQDWRIQDTHRAVLAFRRYAAALPLLRP